MKLTWKDLFVDEGLLMTFGMSTVPKCGSTKTGGDMTKQRTKACI
jgi:hypothetical protein